MLGKGRDPGGAVWIEGQPESWADEEACFFKHCRVLTLDEGAERTKRYRDLAEVHCRRLHCYLFQPAAILKAIDNSSVVKLVEANLVAACFHRPASRRQDVLF